MIDFRYHLVSIIAVFLALAIGIVLGTTTLSDVVLNDLHGRVNTLTEQRRDQRVQIDDLRSRVTKQNVFIQQLEPRLVHGVLTGLRVTVVSAAGTPTDVRSNLVTALRRAGAIVVADVRLAPAYVDPTEASALDDLATRLVVPGASVPPRATGPDLASAELAAVLVAKPGTRPASDDAVQTTLAGFQQGGFLTVEGTAASPGNLAVLLTPPAPARPSEDTAAAARVLVTLAAALDARSGGAVVAGPETAAVAGGVVYAVRRDGAASRAVSTVDSVELAAARVATVEALRDQLAGRTGAFGFAPGTTPLPAQSPAPTPSS